MKPYYDDGTCVIYHGDCRELMPSLTFAAIVTDPPYGVEHDTDYRRFTKGADAPRNSHDAIEGDAEPFDPAPFLKAARRVILFGANCFSDRLPIGSWLVWDKRTPGGAKNVMSDGEVAWFGHGHGVYILSHSWDGFNRASERGTAYHPTQKPVALMGWALGIAGVREGETVLDPFMGSGPTLVAAKSLGLSAVGIDVDERYCEIAARRLAQEVLDFSPQQVNNT